MLRNLLIAAAAVYLPGVASSGFTYVTQHEGKPDFISATVERGVHWPIHPEHFR